MPGPYPLEFRRPAVSLLKRSGKSVPVLAAQLDADAGQAEGLTSEEREELRWLRREVKTLTDECEILKMRSSPRTAGPGDGLQVYRRGEDHPLRQDDVPRARGQPLGLSRVEQAAAVGACP